MEFLKVIIITILTIVFSLNLILGAIIIGCLPSIVTMAISGYLILAILNNSLNPRKILEVV